MLDPQNLIGVSQDLAGLSDEQLLGKVEALAETERFNLVDFLIHLGELDQRDVCRNKGYSSVFAYLTRHLGYSESDAVRRVRTARAAKKFRSIYGMLARGEAHLVGISLLQPFLNSENHRGILNRVRGKSQREIELIAAELSPSGTEPKDRIRLLPVMRRIPAQAQEQLPAQSLSIENRDKVSPGSILPESVAVPLAESNPLEQAAFPTGEARTLNEASRPETTKETRRIFTFVGGERLHRWLNEARDLMRHKFPEGRMEDIFEEALRRLLEQERPDGLRKRRSMRKRNITRKAANSGLSHNLHSPNNAHSRHIPGWIKDIVWRRDGGRCAFVGDTGIRCGETGWLEYDHIKPWALGGRSDDAMNVRLLCRAHNQSQARHIFGSEKIQNNLIE